MTEMTYRNRVHKAFLVTSRRIASLFERAVIKPTVVATTITMEEMAYPIIVENETLLFKILIIASLVERVVLPETDVSLPHHQQNHYRLMTRNSLSTTNQTDKKEKYRNERKEDGNDSSEDGARPIPITADDDRD